jgi:hypothetical protein
MKNNPWPLPAFIAILVCLLAFCQSPVQNPDYACYSSPHFQVYYLESEYTTPEVASITARKERLLDYVNKALDVSFDKVIPTYLYWGNMGTSWASSGGIVCESRDYVLYDDGHEIIHIVADRELGLCRNKFIAEGFAQAFQLAYESQIDQFVSSYKNSSKNSGSIADQIINNNFDYSSFSYCRAGAFIEFLNETYGLSKLKEFYQAGIPDSGKKLSDDFIVIYNSSIKESETRFYLHYFSRSADSSMSKNRSTK